VVNYAANVEKWQDHYGCDLVKVQWQLTGKESNKPFVV
jgi:hypothetical protein